MNTLSAELLLSSINGTVSGGFVVALAFICLIQYLLHVYRLRNIREENEHIRLEMEEIQGDLSLVQKDRTLGRLENHILREMVAETVSDKALSLLLRHYVPVARDGFGAFVKLENDGKQKVLLRRGLSDESQIQLTIDLSLLNRLELQPVIFIEGRELRESGLFQNLATVDRSKARQLFLVFVDKTDTTSRVLVTTDLFPSGASRDQQIELVKRLMVSIAGNLKVTENIAQQQTQLRSASEMLELRSIADKQFDTPLEMLDEFLSSLADKVQAHRIALYIEPQKSGPPMKAIARCGNDLQQAVQLRWQIHEDMLAEASREDDKPQTFNRNQLDRIGIDKLIGQAYVAPLKQDRKKIGLLCITGSENNSFTDGELGLIEWATEYLAKTILNVLDLATMQRQARIDGLTELANRREFDHQIEVEIQLARKEKKECSLLFIDLDRFKSINDRYGHQAGDEALRSIAKCIRDAVSSLRAGDRALTARYGGEEMAVLLPNVGVEGAKRIAELIRAAVEAETIQYQTQEIKLTVSIGIAAFHAHADNVVELIGAADASLYRAKQTGRNRVVCADEVLVESSSLACPPT